MALSKAKEVALPKKKSPAKERRNLVKSLSQYLKDVRSEFRKVIWPGRAEIMAATVVVLTTLAFFAIFTGVSDFSFAKIIETVLP